MSLPDSTASTALGATVVNPVWFVFLDILPDGLRGNSAGWDISLSGTDQPDLDGDYVGVDPDLVSVSDLEVRSGGNGPLTIRLSGIRGLDDEDREILADPANWQGRKVRMWQMIRNAALEQQGAIRHVYTGYMMSVAHIGDTTSASIEIECESYLAAFSAASNRTYLESETFDPGDYVGRALLSIFNGNSSSSLINGATTRPPAQQPPKGRSYGGLLP